MKRRNSVKPKLLLCIQRSYYTKCCKPALFSVVGFQTPFSRNRNKICFISHIYFASHLEFNWMLMLGKKRSIVVQKDRIQSPRLLCLATF